MAYELFGGISEDLISTIITRLMYDSYTTSEEHGFWDKPRNEGEMIALTHQELSEVLEELRNENVNKHKVAEEYADVIIRVLDICGGMGYNLGPAFVNKMKTNRERPHKHGKRF